MKGSGVGKKSEDRPAIGSRRFRRTLRYILILGALAGLALIGMRLFGRSAPPSSDIEAEAVDPNAPHRHVAHLFDPERAADLLEGAKRDRWQQPGRIVKTLHLRPGDAVADIGAGSGYLMPYLSRAVGPQGRVYEEEIQSAYLPMLHRRAEPLGNVRVALGTDDNPQLHQASADCLVLLTVYHEVQHPVLFLSTLHQIARPGGRLALIDFDRNRKGFPSEVEDHQVSEADVLEEARAAGWTLAERHDFIPGQFFLIFRRD